MTVTGLEKNMIRCGQQEDTINLARLRRFFKRISGKKRKCSCSDAEKKLFGCCGFERKSCSWRVKTHVRLFWIMARLVSAEKDDSIAVNHGRGDRRDGKNSDASDPAGQGGLPDEKCCCKRI